MVWLVQHGIPPRYEMEVALPHHHQGTLVSEHYIGWAVGRGDNSVNPLRNYFVFG